MRTMALHCYWFQMRFVLWIVFAVLAVSSRTRAAMPAGGDIAQRIQRGESFLTNLFDTRLQLLPEYPGSRTYWLFERFQQSRRDCGTEKASRMPRQGTAASTRPTNWPST